jgi:hypothetical protein
MTKLGRGGYCDIIWSFPPDQIAAEYEDARQRYAFIADNWLLSRADLQTVLPLAKTEEGDEILY